MDKNKREKLYAMLKNMSDYSIEQPKIVGDLCNSVFLSPAYIPAIDLMVEAFLTVHSFSVLMFEGLISNASAILRILIEQVSAVTVIASSPKAMTEYLNFQNKKEHYYGSVGEEHKRIRKLLIKELGGKYTKEHDIKDYLDYGWVKVLSDEDGERGRNLIIKKAHLEEVIVDIDQQLNAFAHGQRSIFSFIKNKNLADKHVSRIIMIAGKLFLYLCHAKHELLVNESMSSDKFFESYINAKIIYFDLNARSTNARIIEIIKTTDNLDRDIAYSLSSIDHTRGLIYQAELNYAQVNFLARAYIIDLINFMFMICYKMFGTDDNFFVGINSFSDLISKVGLNIIEQYYNYLPHRFSLEALVRIIRTINDEWSPMRNNGQMSEADEAFITDFTTLIHSLFEESFPNVNPNELLKAFISID